MARIRYSQEIKEQAVKLVLEDRQTMIEVARQVGCTPGSVQLWIKKVQPARENRFAMSNRRTRMIFYDP